MGVSSLSSSTIGFDNTDANWKPGYTYSNGFLVNARPTPSTILGKPSDAELHNANVNIG